MVEPAVNRDSLTRKGVLHSPGLIALLTVVAFYAGVLGLLHPGYAINDDIKIIAIAAGYPGVQPSPFLIFSNVLLGFLLVPLYDLKSALNWEIILFIALNIASVWTLLYLVVASGAAKLHRILGLILVLACTLYYALNITFSSTAALACFAGLSAILGGAGPFRVSSRGLLAAGMVLLLAGSLIRIQMLALALPPVLVAALFVLRTLRLRQLAFAAVCAGALVFGGYAFDRLYVRAHTDWNTFYFYNQTAMQIQDSHRLENMHLEIRRIGWSGNDQEVFARYFFPDAGTYSIDRLQYLVDKVSGIGQNPIFTVGSFVQRITSGWAVPSVLILAATFLLILSIGNTMRGKLAIPLVIAAVLSENLAVMLIYKNPDYVFFSSLANAAMLTVLLLIWPAVGASSARAQSVRRGGFSGVTIIGMLAAVLAVGSSARLTLLNSHENLGRQAGYARIQADINEMRRRGTLAQDAVIVSTSHGIPWDWSDPLYLGFPGFTYLDTGWNTFSPYYEEAIRKHGIEPLLPALYERDNVYFISKSIFKQFLALYYEEHGETTVAFETLYALPNPNHYEGYDGVELYKVIPAPVPLP